MQSPCANHAPQNTVQALCTRGKRAVVLPHAFGLLAIVTGWTWCATSTASAAAARTETKTVHSPAHRRLRKALQRQQCSARPLFTRPAWPRRALRLHDYQRAPRNLTDMQAAALCSPCAYHVPNIIPRRRRRTLRSHDYQRVSRKLSVHAVVFCASCHKLFCPGATRGDRGVRYARTIDNAHHVS
jgi:hypothetical protein